MMARRLWGKKSQEQTQPQTELEARAEQEIAMLERNEQYKQMQAKMKPVIGVQEIRKASETLRKYKEGKARLEAKIVANEEFWKLRQWNYMNDGKNDFKPATAWLWSCIQSRYSDIMDSYPTCNFRPRQEDDKAEAQKLSSIVPIIFEQNRYEDTYSDVSWYALKQGGNVQGVFWDSTKHNGLGDITIKKIDFINLFWESGITNIQKSRNVFNTELVANELLEQQYPQCQGKLGGKSISLAKYLYDDNVDTSDKSVVVDWYYKKYVNGKNTLQYVKYVNDIVLYATENDTERPMREEMDVETGIPVQIITGESMAVRGLYDHGMYPFVTMPLYPVEGSLCGYGLTDIGRDTQLQIDMLNKAITDNALAGAKPRYFIKNNGGVNEDEYTDLSKDMIHVEGSPNEDNIRAVDHKPLDGIYVNVLQQKIDEMKFITSNQDVNNGATPNGVTSGSAISALQEASGKNARSSNKSFHRAYREVCYLVVELIRQFYNTPRTFRIMPDGMQEEFITYNNSGLVAQQQMMGGMDMGLRLPEFDIEVTSEKANPYKKMEINELALSFYNMGFFNPQMTDQALACLNMMDFTKKEDVMQKIQANGTLQELLLLYQQMALDFANQLDPELGEQVAMQINQQYGGGMTSPQMAGGTVNLDNDKGEHPFNTKARTQARQSTEAD
jgi:hypothetical protein